MIIYVVDTYYQRYIVDIQQHDNHLVNKTTKFIYLCKILEGRSKYKKNKTQNTKKTKFGGKHKTLAPVATEMILSHNNGGQMT